MQFTTKIPLQKSPFPIDYDSKILLLGSCFTENMGEKFDYFKLKTTVNPFGIIFNAVSLEKLIRRVVENRKFTENDIFFHNELWHCYEVHSELSNSSKEEFLKELNQIIKQSNNQIIHSTHIIITLGTSWIYRNKETNEIVANCHKVPQKEFTKELLSISQTKESLESIISLMHSVNPNCHFIFTVSPVRHLKDGFVENTLSKAHLIAALHKTITHYPLPITYFPSYEIMTDELRDYRFYAEDMLHPSDVAINYIWKRFSENYVSKDGLTTMEEVNAIQKSLLHRSFNANSESHQKFLMHLNEKINTLIKKHPSILF